MPVATNLSRLWASAAPLTLSGCGKRLIALRARLFRHSLLWVLAPAMGLPGSAMAATPMALSSDVSVQIDAEIFQDEDVSVPAFGTRVALDLGKLPQNVDVIAVHTLDEKEHFFVLDIATVLPGGVFVDARDVVWTDGNTFAVYYDGSAEGLPPGIKIDALSIDESNGDLMFSIDLRAKVVDVYADDEDLVLFDGNTYQLLFDGSKMNVPAELDLDGAALLDDGSLALSFSTSGIIKDVSFADEDVLVLDPGGTWVLAVDGSAVSPSLHPADVDALDFDDYFQ